eukprot:s333_g14.t1
MFTAALGIYRFTRRLKGRFADYAKKRAAAKKAREEAELRRMESAFGLDFGEYDEEEAEEEEVTDDEEIVDESDEEDRRLFGDLEMDDEGMSDEPLACKGDMQSKRWVQRDENQLTEWDEVLDDSEVEALNRLVYELQPKLAPPEEMSTQDARLRRDLVRRKPLLKYNAVLFFGESARSARGCSVAGAGALWSCPGKPRPRHVPDLIIVTGHRLKHRGNMGINGLYQRYHQDFHGRPVYQKVLERRKVHKELVTEDGELLPSPEDQIIRQWKPRTDEALVLARRFQSIGQVPDQEDEDVVLFPKLLPSKELWFLFFDDRRGAWCIGPAIGATEIYAKCFTVEESVPCNLGEWEFWDTGLKQWYTHKAVKLIKVG